MSLSEYKRFEEEYGLTLFNIRRGRVLTEDRVPDSEYSLFDLEIRIYDNPEPGFIDKFSPFRPSEAAIVELDYSEMAGNNEVFLEGTQKSIERLERDLQEEDVPDSISDYYDSLV